MNHSPIKNQDLFKAIVLKAGLKQEVYATTMAAFNEFKQETISICEEYHRKIKQKKWPIPFEYKDRGTFEFELKFGGDVLIFFMHTNIFEFSRDHEVMKTSYIKADKTRSYCGIIHIFNFLADSFKYNRTNDVGYLIGRVFINREGHYFIEGKREIGLLYNNFSTSTLDNHTITSILQSSILYTLNFDLLTPPYDNLKEVTLQEMLTTIDSLQIRTGKRLGFRFQADKLSDG
ncbi:MAG: hypothetical protein NTU98_11735 [Bacteroidetes bacterium]|nr:hypothetical protein [Bacteroidota bacterium]